MVVFIAPVLLSNAMKPMYSLVLRFLDTISPIEYAEIYPAFTTCDLHSGKVQVSGDLRLEGADTALIRAHDLAIYEVAAKGVPEVYIARPKDDPSGIILKRSTYVHVELLADYAPLEVAVRHSDGKFPCDLRLVDGAMDSSAEPLNWVGDPDKH